jgi:hypothetical protein
VTTAAAVRPSLAPGVFSLLVSSAANSDITGSRAAPRGTSSHEDHEHSILKPQRPLLGLFFVGPVGPRRPRSQSPSTAQPSPDTRPNLPKSVTCQTAPPKSAARPILFDLSDLLQNLRHLASRKGPHSLYARIAELDRVQS